jgi:hypothetical protein
MGIRIQMGISAQSRTGPLDELIGRNPPPKLTTRFTREPFTIRVHPRTFVRPVYCLRKQLRLEPARMGRLLGRPVSPFDAIRIVYCIRIMEHSLCGLRGHGWCMEGK